MAESSIFTAEFHWLQGVTQSLDVGLVVLDLDFRVVMWNDFMDNHYEQGSADVFNKTIFELFDDLPENWFRQKVRGVFQFKGRAFSTWEQRPYLFRMSHYRPFTSPAKFMYQNITMLPLTDMSGQYTHVGILVYDVTDIALQKIQLQEARDELSILAKTDNLTGLYNRGYWEHRFIQEFSRFGRTRQTPTLMMLDIDHFKRVNDTYGHAAGDAIIQMLANLLAEQLRATDIIGRLGGEEFGVILIDTAAEPSEMLANRIRQIIEGTTTHFDGNDIRITASFGVAELNDKYKDHKHWYTTADQGLYASKAANRNTVTVKQPSN
ncbi:MAG: diguanylate cyclase (GGDEF)-like protein [Candidatus Azotimanducaceae bacterium]|jgi:diguanylate cyclase